MSPLYCMGFLSLLLLGCQGGGSPPLYFISTPIQEAEKLPKVPSAWTSSAPTHSEYPWCFSQVCTRRPHSLPLHTDSTDFSGF